ncbi:hypothetical protein [Hymenobacter guriensis]|uniref:Uncharacterized protein n=1 Tax=Hymenobacter guriensis TaxID=2793065 RepID=A0ABS0L4P7_9BACT|nr:hypothetical protein [Hymenobacter guriensis]MBG8555049.1 hypothetical protein [Hymenobacter guriensis]
MRFVLRLRPDIHAQLNILPAGIYQRSAITDAQVAAFSTLLHETVHWWQHIGSNFGLLTTLKYPSQAHMLHVNLQELLAAGIRVKSLVEYAFTNPDLPVELLQHLNRALNYWFDLETAGALTEEPKRTPALTSNTNPFFLNTGHCFHMWWSAVVQTLAATFDPAFDFLPNVTLWSEPFNKLSARQEEGFFEGSKIRIPPLGTQAIYEGQARLCQLQYLHHATGRSLADYAATGMLEGVYGEAFAIFLEVLREEQPTSATDPLVGLFLLICDIALNPTDGFPFDITHHESFVFTNDPGHRFLLLCQYLMLRSPELKRGIVRYDKAEYVQVSGHLAGLIACHSPYESSTRVNEWIAKEVSLHQLLSEEAACDYQPGNFPIRLLFSKYLRFQQDKLDNPHFFCWPGMYLVDQPGQKPSLLEVKSLFSRHQAFFSDDEHGNIYPLRMPGVPERQLAATRDEFYAWHCTYDLVRQWVVSSGPFTFDYSWLSQRHTPEAMAAWASDLFHQAFGVAPQEFTLIAPAGS